VQGRAAGNNPSAPPIRQGRQPQPGIAGPGRGGNSPLDGIGELLRRLMGSTPLPLVLLVLAVVALLVIWALLANSCSQKSDGYVPVISGNAGQGADEPDEGDILPLVSDDGDIAPGYGPFILKLEPAPGSAPWVHVVVDGKVEFDDSLGSTRSYTVYESCEVQVFQTDNLRIYRNDVLQQPTINERTYMGTVALAVIERPINDNTTNNPVDEAGPTQPATNDADRRGE